MAAAAGARVEREFIRAFDLEPRGRYAFLLPRFLPPSLFNRATGWMPIEARRARNYALVATAIEFVLALASLPIGFTRGGVSRLSAGINLVLAMVSLVGAFGAVRCVPVFLWLHFLLAWTLVGLFVLFIVISVAASGNSDESEAYLLLAVFAFLVVDVVVGVFTFLAFRALRAYERQCKAEDEAAGGEGRGVLARHAEVAREILASEAAGGRGEVAVRPAREAADDAKGADAAADGPAVPGAAMQPDDAARADEVIRRAELVARATSAREGAAPPAAKGDTGRGADAPARAMCPVCMDKQQNAVFVDCGHGACEECAEGVRRRFGHCFFCRKRIVSVLRVYL
ncbi:hypothetical protein FNF27_01403 [Cafeteria roenbergensis]|uniref:RING-type domain-containing protein n=1 Tax=Cafeteria roenbergensis TaxID=33653 RepID=A0A5A8EGP4_CAFRO|nr:hypothetical protein FNF27_01403 [Cafeteria roenbergensis]